MAIEPKLSPIQASVLLHRYLTGDFPPRRFSTVQALLDKGMLKEAGKLLYVTSAGAAYCDAHHTEIKFITKA